MNGPAQSFVKPKMDHGMPSESILRVALLSSTISHFEVPLYRLCAEMTEIDFKVFYVRPVSGRVRFDDQYRQEIDWGIDLLAGYDAVQVAGPESIHSAVPNWQADVIVIYGYSWPGAIKFIIDNWRKGRPQVHRGTLTFHLDPRRPFLGRLMRPLRKIILRLFHAHHFGGEHSRKVLLDAGIAKSDLFFVPYSVDTPYFIEMADSQVQIEKAQSIRKTIGWNDSSQVILFIAQHNWFKGPDIAMEVFRRVAENNAKARFLVLGSGSMTKAMKASVADLIDTNVIHFSGFIPSAETIPYYLASDLVLCSSRYETWARMVNECMLCRRPCVTSKAVPATGGLIVHGENGFVVDENKTGSLVDAIARYFSLSAAEKSKMGEMARARAIRFSYESALDNVIAAAQHAVMKAGKKNKAQSF